MLSGSLRLTRPPRWPVPMPPQPMTPNWMRSLAPSTRAVEAADSRTVPAAALQKSRRDRSGELMRGSPQAIEPAAKAGRGTAHFQVDQPPRRWLEGRGVILSSRGNSSKHQASPPPAAASDTPRRSRAAGGFIALGLWRSKAQSLVGPRVAARLGLRTEVPAVKRLVAD